MAVGCLRSTRRDDYITSTHRGHGHVIAKGGDPSRMMAELYGRVTGYCKGKGGSMHITDLSWGCWARTASSAAACRIAVGAAFSAKLLGAPTRWSRCVLRRRRLQRGPFHEAMNMAAVWKLPVVFVCENNDYA